MNSRDHLVKDDKVVTDKIYSTLNGYIENFKELEVRQDTDSVSIKAVVTVSPTRIINFAKVIGGATTEISGGSILGEAQREIEARAIRTEMFGRLFRGVPNDAFDLKITNVHAANDNPQLLELTVNISLNTEWFRQFRAGLEAIGQKLLDVPDKTDSSCYNIAHGHNDEWFKIRDASFANSSGATTLCVRDDKTHTLYLLPLGNYEDELFRIFVTNFTNVFFGSNCYFSLSIVLGFSNKSQSYKSQCVETPSRLSSPFKLDVTDHPHAFGLNFVNRALVIKIPIANIDLSHSEQISGALLLPVVDGRVGRGASGLARSSKFKTDVFDDPSDLSDVCENYVYRRALHQ
jgi:hypothetical protein